MENLLQEQEREMSAENNISFTYLVGILSQPSHNDPEANAIVLL
jgi:hypothetical protein